MIVQCNRLIATTSLLIVSTICMIAPALANPLERVDQAQTTVHSTIDVLNATPLGQSFVPANTELNFVEFNLQDSSDTATGSHAYVNIRYGDINGPVIVSSEILYLRDCFNLQQEPGCRAAGGAPAPARFLFTEDVSVEPGETYVLELVAIPGMDRFSAGIAARDIYSGGGYYKNGEHSAQDLWFRVGYKQHNVVGDIPGLTGARIICHNETTTEKVTIRNYNGGPFDCEAAGLAIRPGDNITLQIAGRVQ